jgi:hypothetical protein
MWANLAAAQEHEAAIRTRELLEREMTPESIAEAQRLSREWKPKVLPKPEKPATPSAEVDKPDPVEKTQSRMETKSDRGDARTAGATMILTGMPIEKAQSAKPASMDRPSHQAKPSGPRFDFGAFSGAALPGIVILSGVALGILIRNRQDAARIATGNPPLRYGHEIGALAAIFYLAGVGALVALPKSGSWLIALALGALFHFMKIGSLRKRAEKEAANAGV